MKDFTMERVTVDITYKCSLKCKLCSNYAPYMLNAKQNAYSLDYWIKVMNRFFEMVSYVKVFTISGGEPLIYPEFYQFLNCIGGGIVIVLVKSRLLQMVL